MSRKISWISTSYYPFFLGATCFFLVLYKFFPSPFALVLNSSLLIVCSILFLRILGRYGRNGKKEKLTLRSSSLRVELIKNDLRAKKLESLKCNPQARSRRTFKGMTIRAVAPGDDAISGTAACKAVDEGNGFNIQMDATCFSSTFLLKEDKDRDELTEKLAEDFLADMGQEETCLATSTGENFAIFGAAADKIKSDNGDSCLGSPWCHVEHQDACSSAEFDGEESSDLCAANLDPHVSDENKSNEVVALSENQVVGSSKEEKEKEQLEKRYTGDGDQETEQPEDKKYTGDGDQETEQLEKNKYTGDGDQETEQLETNKYTGDGDQETEQLEKKYTGDGDQETEQLEKKCTGDGDRETELLEKKKLTGDGDQETQEKSNGNKVGIKLMDLGVSESERNRRLQSLIAKRKARKAMERNVKDLDDNTETSESGSQLPSITAPRRNPSDLLYDFDESIPGSAPSILLPRMSVFDLSEEVDDDDDDDDDEYISSKHFITHPLREILFTRHESFTIGASFFSDVSQARRATRLRPFIGEAKNEEPADTSGANLHTSLGEVCDSKFSFTSESDTDSTISDQEHEQDLAQVCEYCPIQPNEGSSHSSSSLSSDIELRDVKQIITSSRMNIGSAYCPIQTNERSSQSSSEDIELMMDDKQVNTSSRMNIGSEYCPIQTNERSSQSSSDIELMMDDKQVNTSSRMNIGSEYCPIQTNERSSRSSSEDIELMLDVKQVNASSRMNIGSEYCAIQTNERSSQSSSEDIELMLDVKQVNASSRMNIGSEYYAIQTNERSSQSSSSDIELMMDVKQVNASSRMNIGSDRATQVIDDSGMIRDDVSEVSVSSSLITYADQRPEVDEKHAINYYCIPPGITVEEAFELKQKINGGESSTEANNLIALDSDVVDGEADQVHVETLDNAGSASKTECSILALMDESESVSRERISESKELNVCRDEACRAEEDLSDSKPPPSLPKAAAANHSMMHHSNISSSTMDIEPINNS